MSYEIDPIDKAVHETVHEFRHMGSGKKGVPALAPVLGMPPSTLQNKSNPNEEYANLTLKEARAVMLATGDHRIVRVLANEVGEACVTLPSIDFAADMDVLDAWGNWQTEIAETVQRIQFALSDGKIDAREVEDVRRELVEDFEKGLALLDVLKGMMEPEDNVTRLRQHEAK